MKVKLLKELRRKFRERYAVYALKVAGVTYYSCSRIHKHGWLKKDSIIEELRKESYFFMKMYIASYRAKKTKRVKLNIWK